MKLKHFILIIAVSFLFSEGMGQVVFQRTYGSIGNDGSGSVWHTDDGGYIMVGNSRLNTNSPIDMHIVKFDNQGNIEWKKMFGSQGFNYAKSVQQTTDGSYIITGETSNDLLLLKINAAGNELFTTTIEEIGYTSSGTVVKQTADGGYIVIGNTDNYGVPKEYIYLVKFDGSGNLLWGRAFGKNTMFDLDWGIDVQETVDGNFIMIGFTYNMDSLSNGTFLIKTNSTGDLLWDRVFYIGGYTNSVQPTIDGGYIMAGSVSVGFINSDAFLTKTNSSGDTLWTKTYGGPQNDGAYSVIQTPDGGFAFTGVTQSFGSVDSCGNSLCNNVLLVKTDSVGNVLWTKVFGGYGDDGGRSISFTSDSGYAIGGWTNSFGEGDNDFYLIKTDQFGNSECNQYNASLTIGSVPMTISGGSIQYNGGTGTSISLSLSNSTFLQGNPCVSNNGFEFPTVDTHVAIHPNPFTTSATVEIKSENNNAAYEFALYDQLGRQVRHIANARSSFVLEREGLPAGIYCYTVQSKGQPFGRGKLVVY